MKRIITNILLITILLGVHVQIFCQVSKVITYNIKYDNPKDSINKWDNRKLELVSMFKHYEPDIFGIQEGLEHQLIFLDQHLTNYSRIGVGRDDGKQKGEFSPIYYDKNKFSLVSSSTFWLSDQDSIVSIGWDAAMERICTYGILENRINQNKILVLNTHFDHIGEIARKESSILILSKINDVNQENYPVILMGDFNAEPGSNPINILNKELNDGAELSSEGIYGPIGTYTGFKKNELPKRRIDFIFTKNLSVSNIDTLMIK